MSSSPTLPPQKLSPAMMRLPPSPDTNAMAAGKTLIPEFSLDDDTVIHRGNLSSNVAVGGVNSAVGHQHNNVHHQQRLRSVAKYNAFHPQALACSNDILTTSYKDQFESPSLDSAGPASLGAIAGPRGVALFRLSRPHIPLLIFSHATNFSSSLRKNQKGRNSISSLAFQPTNRGNTSTINPNSLYLAAARGSGVLIWDASGHSPNPLLGRLLNDTTNDTGIASSIGGRRDLDSRITSMSWMSYCGGVSSSSSPLLATTTASSVSMWDLRCHLTTGLCQPSLRFGSSRNAGLASTSSSLTPVAPLVQVACSSCSEECATMDASGIVRTYDLRKTEGGGRSSAGCPLAVFVAHEAGVGIDHLPRTQNGTTESAWVTWGLEAPMSSAVVKVWGGARSSTMPETIPRDDSSDLATIIHGDEKEDYWFMGDESQKASSSIDGINSNKGNNDPKRSSDYQLIAQYERSSMCCARVCAAPIENSLVVVGYLDDKPNPASNSMTSENGGWWIELMTLSSDSDTNNGTLDSEFRRKGRGNFGLDQIVSFSGGTANSDTLTSALGNTDVGRLQAAELAFSSSIITRNKKSVTMDDDSNRIEKTDEATVELLVCCLSDTGVLTTTAIPEAMPAFQPVDVQNRDNSPQRSLTRLRSTFRTAFASTNNKARVFPETQEGNSLIDVASMWGAKATRNDTSLRRGDEKSEQSRSSSPLKLPVTTEDSLRNIGRRSEGGFMPFDMDVPVPVAYNSVAAGNLGGIQLGLTEMTPLSAIINTSENGAESNIRNQTSIMENIDKERVPCPGLCGAVFGSGNGRLAIFRNGEVKKMWNWYQRTDTIRLSGVPGGQLDVSPSSDPQTLLTEPGNLEHPSKRDQVAPSYGPRTLKDLTEMLNAAKEAQWGETNDASVTEDGLSVMGNFFEDESLDSNSDDSGNDDEDDDDDDDDDDDMLQDTDEMYKRYFGGRSWKGFSEMRASMEQGQNTASARAILHRSIGPSSDMLQPVVKVSSVSCEKQNTILAKGWKLGRWKDKRMRSETHPSKMVDDVLKHRPQIAHDFNTLSKKESSSFHKTMSVPDLSRISDIGSSMDDIALRDNMEESMTFLKKLFSHHQEGGITFPTTIMSPPDSKILMNQREKDSLPGRQSSESDELRSVELGLYTMRNERIDGKTTRLNELEEIHQLCLHNAGISKACNDVEKESVWNLLAEVAITQMNQDGKMSNGWGGKGGGALGIDMISNLFTYYESLGDVQMLATMFCVLNGHQGPDKSNGRRCLLPRNLEKVSDTYIIRYGELLYAWGLLNTRVELNKHLRRHDEQTEFQFPSVEDSKEDGLDLGVAMTCPKCDHEVNSSTNYCLTCRDFAFRCSICDIAVRGLFTFCEICKHGGHLSHMVDWFSKNSFCPTGCGCQCRLSPMLHAKTEIANQEIY